jgi:hypothetical protein
MPRPIRARSYIPEVAKLFRQCSARFGEPLVEVSDIRQRARKRREKAVGASSHEKSPGVVAPKPRNSENETGQLHYAKSLFPNYMQLGNPSMASVQHR